MIKFDPDFLWIVPLIVAGLYATHWLYFEAIR